MADRLIGRAVVEVTSDNTKLESGMRSAEDRVAASTDKMVKGMRGVKKETVSLGAVMSKLAVPTAVAGAIVGLIGLVVKLKDAWNEVDEAQNAALGGIRDRIQNIAMGMSDVTDEQKAQITLAQQQRAEMEALDKTQSSVKEGIIQWGLELGKFVGIQGAALEETRRLAEQEQKRADIIAAQNREMQALQASQEKAARLAAEQAAEEQRIADAIESQKKDTEAMLAIDKAITEERKRQLDLQIRQLETIREIQQIQQDITGQGFGAFGEVGAKLTGIERELAAMSSAFRAGRSGR
jgi:hypothetical protein